MNIVRLQRGGNFVTGTVNLINPKRGMVVVQIDHGDFTVFEVLCSYEINLGDEIVGNLNSLGGETLYNRTKNEHFDVFIEDIHATPDNARQLLR